MSEPKDNRVPIMMSNAELDAIDDWRFENRIATRSEAIRRLCQMGLHFDRESTTLHKSSKELMELIFKAHKEDDSVVTAEFIERTAALFLDVCILVMPSSVIKTEENPLITDLVIKGLKDFAGKNSDEIKAILDQATKPNK